MANFSLLSQDIAQNEEEKNLENILNNAKKAKEKNSSILLTPELSLQGFPDNPDLFLSSAIPVKEESIDKIKDFTYKHQMFIGFGYFEEQQKDLYNTYSIAGPAGTLIASQRKRKTFKFAKENLYVKSASETKDFKLLGLKTRMIICFSLRFPELFSSKEDKPYLYIVPANWPTQRICHWKALLIARAIENQAWVIGINRWGGNCNGHSMVIDPNGNIIIRNDQSIANFSIDKEIVTKLRERFPLN